MYAPGLLRDGIPVRTVNGCVLMLSPINAARLLSSVHSDSGELSPHAAPESGTGACDGDRVESVAPDSAPDFSALVSADDAGRRLAGKDVHALYYQDDVHITAVGAKLRESMTLLLENGLAYVGLTSSPLNLRLPTGLHSDVLSASEYGWSAWREQGDGIELWDADTGSWYALVGECVVDAAEGGVEAIDVSGHYRVVRSETWGRTVFTERRDYYFGEDGRFACNASTHTTSETSDSAGLNTDQLSVYAQSDPGGGFGIATGTSADADGTISDVLNAQAHQDPDGSRHGTYEILDDGLTVLLRYANGTVRRRLIFRNSNGMFIGDRSYTPALSHFDTIDVAINTMLGLSVFDQRDARDWRSVIAESVRHRKG